MTLIFDLLVLSSHMHKYIFITGRNQHLSIAEILSRLGPSSYFILSDDAVLINLDNPIENPIALQNTLGGTIKICQNLKASLNFNEIKEVILSYLPERHLGLSFYGDLNVNPAKIIKLKKDLKKADAPKRFIFNKDLTPLNAATIKKNKLITKGSELCVIQAGREIHFAQTISYQDIDNYTLRDYGKPKPDPKSGMLPPKLAQMMIGLAKLKPGNSIYDPFCGSGTVLQEALLQKLDINGSDLSEKAVSQTKENLKWLINKFRLDIPDFRTMIDHRISPADATTHKLVKPVDGIVTEPYLGPVHRSSLNPTQIATIREELLDLYRDFLKNNLKNLKPGGHLVMVLPIWQTNPIIEITPDDLLDQSLTNQYNQICLKNLELIYQQPNQRVHRRIMILKKVKVKSL